jgi:hypothetical protein
VVKQNTSILTTTPTVTITDMSEPIRKMFG